MYNKRIQWRQIIVLVQILCIILVHSEPLGRSRLKATHVDAKKFSLASLFVWPNTYYDIPKHRYPYYDESGTGRLLYGYGGSDLYRYSVFKPLEGYFR